MTPDERQVAADALWMAEVERRPIGPLTVEYPGMDVSDAYAVQLLNVQRRVATGRVVRGQKVGLSSRAMQEMMGVDEPDYGHLLDDMFVFEDGDVEVATLCQPRIEPEVAFILREQLPTVGCNVADVLRSTAYLVPAIEIIDSRIADWKISLCDTVADNASSGRLVLGGRATPIDRVDLRTLEASLWRNGEVLARGSTGAVLGNPVTAVAWLANKLGSFGAVVEAGSVVLPGSCTRAFDVTSGDCIQAMFDTVGGVAVNFV
jgi:2-keto-4-pentenoate hydratase